MSRAGHVSERRRLWGDSQKPLAKTLKCLSLSAIEFVEATGIDERYLSVILNTLKPITADVAARIGKALDMTPEFWLGLQSDYDLEMAARRQLESNRFPSLD